MKLPGKKLTKEDVLKLDLPKDDLSLALMMFELEADVYLLGETDEGYDITYVMNPKALIK